MTQKVQLLRSNVAGHVPSPASLLPGELAVNLPDKRLFAGDASGNPIDLLGVLVAQVLAEGTARAAADSTETAARAAADSAEATARTNADNAEITARTNADNAEITARTNADATETAARIAADNAEITARNAAITAAFTSKSIYLPTGADPTGAADSQPAIQAAINAAIAAGGGVVLVPVGVFKLNTSLVISASNVKLVGMGRGAFHDIAPYTAAPTRFVWGGGVNPGAVMVLVQPALTAGSQKLTDVAVQGIALQGSADLVAAGAGFGLLIYNTQHSYFDVFVSEFNQAGVYMAVAPNVTGEASNCEGNRLDIRFRQINQPGAALVFAGSARGNCCFNTVDTFYGYIQNGIGVDFQDCDNNIIDRAWIDRIAGGTGINVLFRSNPSGLTGCARANTIRHLSTSVHSNLIWAQGTEQAGATQASYANRIELFDSSNVAPTVMQGTGATFFMTYNMSPIGLRDSNTFNANDFRVQLSNGVILFGGAIGPLGAGTYSTITLSFGVSKILMVQVAPQAVGATGFAFNYAGRTDGAINKFDVYSAASAYATYFGFAQA